jgi:glucose 1-dehydrogenase
MIGQGMRPSISRAAGKILFVSSVHEIIPWAGHKNYAASKGGVKLFMQSLAQELAAHRIRVNAIAPGAIMTLINRPAWGTPEALAALLRLTPYGCNAQAWSVAEMLRAWHALAAVSAPGPRSPGGRPLEPAAAEAVSHEP